MNGATAVEKSRDRKLSLSANMSATWVSQDSCDPLCPWIGTDEEPGPCYYEHGCANWTRLRLNRESRRKKLNPEKLARAEARAIRGLTGKRHIRVHVGGDCRTNKAARIVSDACAYHKRKHGKGAHAYTHSWRVVDRASWQEVSVLASVESWEDARAALMRGFAPAIVVGEKHASKKAYKVDELTAIPCPQQTGASPDCEHCKLCFDDRALWQRKAVIVFQPDGNTQETIKQTLIQIGGNTCTAPTSAA